MDRTGAGTSQETESSSVTDRPFKEAKRIAVNRFECEYLQGALTRYRGNVSRAARASGKARRAFFELMRKHNLNAPDFRAATG